MVDFEQMSKAYEAILSVLGHGLSKDLASRAATAYTRFWREFASAGPDWTRFAISLCLPMLAEVWPKAPISAMINEMDASAERYCEIFC